MKKNSNNKTILVTGGSGFLGSHLCEKLLEKGNNVICVDNFFTGSKNNVKSLLFNPNFELVTHDITLPFYPKVDAIYNFACPASPIHYQQNPIQTIKTCLLGSINMLELAKKINIPILQASTSEIYGNPEEHPQKESYWGNVNPIGSRSCYDEGKRAAETLFHDYRRYLGINSKIIRIFNTYGPKMSIDDGRVVSNFIVQALLNKDITIYGKGLQTRSFCYVDDLIDGAIKMMETSEDFFGPVNLGNPDELTIKQLAELIIELTDSESKITFKELPKDDPLQRKPDITLAKNILNWQPKVNLEKGLEITINYFKKIIRLNI